jgi:hypothetical protein
MRWRYSAHEQLKKNKDLWSEILQWDNKAAVLGDFNPFSDRADINLYI